MAVNEQQRADIRSKIGNEDYERYKKVWQPNLVFPVREDVASTFDILNAMGQEKTFAFTKEAKFQLIYDNQAGFKNFGILPAKTEESLIASYSKKLGAEIEKNKAEAIERQGSREISNLNRAQAEERLGLMYEELSDGSRGLQLKAFNPFDEDGNVVEVKRMPYKYDTDNEEYIDQMYRAFVSDTLTTSQATIDAQEIGIKEAYNASRRLEKQVGQAQNTIDEFVSAGGDINSPEGKTLLSKAKTLIEEHSSQLNLLSSGAQEVSQLSTLQNQLVESSSGQVSPELASRFYGYLKENTTIGHKYYSDTSAASEVDRYKLAQDVYDEHVSSGKHNFDLQPIAPDKFDEIVNSIEDKTLATLYKEAHSPVTIDGKIMQRPISLFGMFDVELGDEPSSYFIKGIYDIEDLDKQDALNFLESYDAGSVIDAERKQALQINENTNLDPTLSYIQEYRNSQYEMSIQAKRAKYLEVASGKFDEAEVVSQAKATKPQSTYIPNRIKALMGDTSLVEAKGDVGNVKRVSEEWRADQAFDPSLGVKKPSAEIPQRNLLSFIDAMEGQHKFPALHDKAADFSSLLRQYQYFSDSLSKGNYEAIAGEIRSGSTGYFADGAVRTAYRTAMESRKLDYNIDFQELSPTQQMEIAESMADEMVYKLDGALAGIEGEIKNVIGRDSFSNKYKALGEYNSRAGSEINAAADLYDKGIAGRDTVTEYLDSDYNDFMRDNIEGNINVMEAQSKVLLENAGNGLYNKDKKDYQAYIASAKENYDLISPLDVGEAIPDGMERRVNHFTLEDLQRGSLVKGTEEIPLDRFKQFYTLNSMKEIYGKEWNGFTPEQWDRGMVDFGGTTMPIRQFVEYYTPDEQKKQRQRTARHTINSESGKITTFDKPLLSPEDIKTFRSYLVAENYQTNGGKVLVPRTTDPKLRAKLERAKSSNADILVENNIVPYSVEKIIPEDSMAVLRERHVNIGDASFSFNYDGEGNFFDQLEETERLFKGINSPIVDRLEGSKKRNLIDYQQKMLNKPIIGMGNLTRRDLLNSVTTTAGVPRIVQDTAVTSFSWMGTNKDAREELIGVGYEAAVKAFSETSDQEISATFSRFGIDPTTFAMQTKEMRKNLVYDAFAHRTEVNLLLGYMQATSTSPYNPMDTIMRAARNIGIQQGVSNPTADQMQGYLMQLQKGVAQMKSEEVKAYFKDVNKLASSITSIKENMGAGSSLPPISLEVIKEIQGEEIDDEVLEDFAKLYAGPEASVEEIKSIKNNLTGYTNQGTIRSKDFDLPDVTLDADGAITGYTNNQVNELFEKELQKIANTQTAATLDELGISNGLVKDLYNKEVSRYKKHKLSVSSLRDVKKTMAPIGSKPGKEAIQTALLKALEQSPGVDQNVRKVITDNIEVIATNATKNKKAVANVEQLLNNVSKNIQRFTPLENKTITPQMRMSALFNMAQKVPGSAQAFTVMNGGIRNTLGSIFGISPDMIGNIEDVQAVFNKMTFGSVNELRSFTAIIDLIPNTSIGVNWNNAEGKMVRGTIGSFKDASGRIDSIITTEGGEKLRLTNADDEAIRLFALGSHRASDVVTAKHNVAAQHASVITEGNQVAVAGFIGNYDQMTRRANYGTSGIDAISTIHNVSSFKKGNAAGVMFDFETTGLPDKMPDGFSKAFAPIELSYAYIDTAKDLNIKKRDVFSMYARPNETVSEMFRDSMAMDKFDLTLNGVAGNPAKGDSYFHLLKNYAKYDTSHFRIGEKRFTAGGILTANMSLGESGTLLAHINGEALDTGLTPDQYVSRMKESADKVFNYLSTAKEGDKKRFGIDVADIFDEKAFMERFGEITDEADLLMGHNISTADVPWAMTWADRNKVPLPSDIRARVIDTQDLLQGSQPGRQINNLEQFAPNNVKSHLAWADVMTNGKLLKTLLKDSQVNNMIEQVDRGIQKGDYIMKNNANHMGMQEIGDGLYMFDSFYTNKRGEGMLNLIPILPDGSQGERKTYKAENVATVRKELADNWSNFKADKEVAVTTLTARRNEAANRTLWNAVSNGALDRYTYFGEHGNFNFQRDLVKAFKATHDNYQESPLLGAGSDRFTSRGTSDLLMLIQANAKKLTDDGFEEELRHLNSLDITRLPEMEHLNTYMKTDEGRMLRKGLKQVELLERAGIIDAPTRRILGTTLEHNVNNIKQTAIEQGKLGADYMMEVPGKFKVGDLKFDDLPLDMQEHLSAREAGFGAKPMYLTLDSAEQIKSDIFKMGEEVAQGIKDIDNVGDINKARQRVVNEVILPKLKAYSKDENLNAAITARLVDEVDPVYKSAVYSMATEIASNKATIESMAKQAGSGVEPLKVLNTTKALDVNVKEQKVILGEIQSMLNKTILETARNSMVYLNPDSSSPDKYIPIPNRDEIIKKLMEVQHANDKGYTEAVANSPEYKNLVQKYGYDPLAEGYDILPMWDKRMENSRGRKVSKATLAPYKEGRVTSNPKHMWMASKTADELTSIANSMQTSTNTNSFDSVVRAFMASESNPRTAEKRKYHEEFNDDIVAFLNERMQAETNRPDVSYIREINESYIDKWKNEYRTTRGNVQGSTKHKGEIIRELWKRALSNEDHYGNHDAINALRNGLSISEAQIKRNPTKYNAMRNVGLLQFDESVGWYTGGVGVGSYIPGKTLDPSKVIVPGNASGKLKGTRAGDYKSVTANQYAGLPLTALSTTELELVANNKEASYNTGMFESYLKQLNGKDAAYIDEYNRTAKEIKGTHYKMDRTKNNVKIHDLVSEYTVPTTMGTKDYIRGMNEATVNRKLANLQPTTPTFQQVVGGLSDNFTDNPLYKAGKENLDNIKQMIKQNKMAFGMGAGALALIGGLMLTSKRTSSGRTPEQAPQPNQAPAVDGTYDKEYNKYEGSNEHFIPNTKTIHLKEGGGGLNVRARGINRSGIPDGNFDNAVSDTMNSTLSANVNINHSDNRASIDGGFIQGLVSNALFG